MRVQNRDSRRHGCGLLKFNHFVLVHSNRVSTGKISAQGRPEAYQVTQIAY